MRRASFGGSFSPVRLIWALGLALLVAACGGGGGGGSSSAGSGAGSTTTSTPAPALTNLATLTVDAGPSGLNSGPDGYIQADVAYVSITLCAPGTSNCQTIDHIQVDTGSVGLRLFAPVLNASLVAALPTETDDSGNAVGECYGYVDGYAFGSVRQADFQVGGETVANMPLQVIADSGVFSNVPSGCSSGGGVNLNSIQSLGANGVIGIGFTTADCGAACTVAGGQSAASYYDCPTTGCTSIIARAASASAPFQQLPNPIAAMSVDNNGTIIDLPSAPSGGEVSLTGTIYFGIGTQSNNALGSAHVLGASLSTDPDGGGFVAAVYKNQTLPDSFIDSGSNFYIFTDASIAQCTDTQTMGYYCPSSPQGLSPTIQGANGASASASFTLNNAETLFSTGDSVLPGLGGDPNTLSNLSALSTSFDFGLPFFFGRRVYTAIEGRSAGGVVGPYFAY